MLDGHICSIPGAALFLSRPVAISSSKPLGPHPSAHLACDASFRPQVATVALHHNTFDVLRWFLMSPALACYADVTIMCQWRAMDWSVSMAGDGLDDGLEWCPCDDSTIRQTSEWLPRVPLPNLGCLAHP